MEPKFEPKQHTPEEIAQLEKSRTISDAELLKGGAEYIMDEKGEEMLYVNEEQKHDISLEYGSQELLNLFRKRIFAQEDPKTIASSVIFNLKKEIGGRQYFGVYGGVTIDGIKVMIESNLSSGQPARTIRVPLQNINIDSLGLRRIR